VYSDFSPSAPALAQQLRGCLDGRDESSWVSWIEGLEAPEAGDIWLCASLADGDAAAIRVFEQRLNPEIDRALARFALSDDQRVELAQRVRVRLLVETDDSPPRIALYRGWGSLEGWTRTLTARLALNAIRDSKGAEPLDRAPDLLGASPEFEALRSSSRVLFLQALRTAFRALGQRERTLLRLRYLDDVQANALAASYGVHESTMSRWLASARATLQARFEVEARALVKDDADVADLLTAMQSRFGASLQQLFVSEIADATEG
jgi:RNA polymerase sigma-70 factor